MLRVSPPPPLAKREESAACSLLWLQSRFLDDTLGDGAILGQELGKVLRRVEHRLEAHLDQALLAEFRVGADPGDLVAQLADDRLRGAGRRDDAEIDAREVVAIAEL